ncbi:MAG TPA: hypothetical protein VLB47_02580 [Solirubrobacteraceae bacterium]|nr:hypothetical protein [Solirubrobacteraceae bacterium]
MGEKDTSARYPNLIESLVAAGNDPRASAVNLAELRAGNSSFASGARCGCGRASCCGWPCRRW